MLQTAIVPHHQGVWPVVHAHLAIQTALDVPIEHVEQMPAFELAQPLDVRREAGIYIESFLSRNRMLDNHRVF